MRVSDNKVKTRAGGGSAECVSVGEIVRTKLRGKLRYLGILSLAACMGPLSGCGGSNGANIITVAVTPSGSTNVIVGTSLMLTALVTGGTNLNVTWSCTFTTTPTPAAGATPTPTAAVDCGKAVPAGAVGNISDQQNTTVLFNAPTAVPDPTKFQSLLITITATSMQDTKRTGVITLTLDSGISVVLNPVTATVPTKEQEQFQVMLENDTQSKGVTWLITQTLPSATNPATPVPMLPTCSPDCGMIDPKSGLYTAPATVPTNPKTTTPANVTVVVTANGDTTRFATGTITIIAGGAITFNGISPTIAPQGALFWDIYLDSPLISSVSTVSLTSPGGQAVPVSANQVKVLFPIPTTATPNPASTGARVRLLAQNLANAGSFTVSVTDRAEPVTQSPTGVFTFNVLPTRTTSISSVPDDVIQGTLGPQTIISIDGGYFGPGGARANVLYGGNLIPTDVNNSNARQLNAAFPNSGLNSGNPGLYQLSVTSTSSPAPVPNNPSVTNLAVFPDYSVAQPTLATNLNPANPPVVKPIPAGVNPSAIDIDTDLGVVVVAEASSNAIQFFRIVASTPSAPGTLVPIDTSGNDCVTSCPVTGVGNIPMHLPVGVSVNRTNHTVAVVNYGQQMTPGTVTDQTVMDFSIPVPGGPQNPVPGTPFAVDISKALLGAVVPAPMAYAIGVDPDTNHALVAYSSIPSSTSFANLGFIVNLNPPQDLSKDCALAPPTPPFTQGCLFAQVTLNTGLYPQIAFAPHGSIAFVTPGGSGAVSGINVTKASNSVTLTSIMLGAGVVTVATASPHGLIPGNAGSVLITGVPTMNDAGNTNFNGVFSVTVDSSTTFSYALPNSTASGTVDLSQIKPPLPIPTVFFSSPNLQFGVSQTTQGIAINPITRTAALADANATGTNGPEIDLLNSLDQSVSSITFFANCTKFTTNPACSNAPEFPGTTNLSWQPYTNSIVSYNPSPVHNLSQVSISDPVSRQRYAIVPTPPSNPQTPQTYLGPGGIAIPVMNGNTQNAQNTQNTLTLWGGIAVDPATNLAFVAESGSAATQTTPANPGAIEVISLGLPGLGSTIAVKPLEITEVLVPSPTPGVGNVGGIPNTVVPEATLTSPNDLSGVQIFGSGFGAAGNNTTQVRLDQTPIPVANVQVINDRKLIATIPHSFLSAPHHFALDIVNGGLQSNASDFLVIKAIDLTGVCAGGAPHPTAVAIADQIATGPFSPIAVVTNTGCNNIAVIDINPADVTFGSVINTAAVGSSPQGIAVSQRFGLAVVANNGDGTASVIDLKKNPPVQAVPAVQTGANAQPTGVAINEATGAALVANFNANTVSEIDLALLTPPVTTPPTAAPTTLTATSIGGIQQPIAVAIDPDRGTNNQGLAVVTALQIVGGAAPNGLLSSVDIGLASPALSTTAVVGSVSATPTGVVFDPTAFSGSANGGLFYAVSSGGNTISTFNPDTGAAIPVTVGINPTSIAYNPQTGALLTANFGGKSISIVDMLSNPFKTRQTLGFPGSLQFGVAIDQFTNLAVIVDQGNNRVLLFPMPN
jgi:DNA-binding beta-propeller fold protein YncE